MKLNKFDSTIIYDYARRMQIFKFILIYQIQLHVILKLKTEKETFKIGNRNLDFTSACVVVLIQDYVSLTPPSCFCHKLHALQGYIKKPSRKTKNTAFFQLHFKISSNLVSCSFLFSGQIYAGQKLGCSVIPMLLQLYDAVNIPSLQSRIMLKAVDLLGTERREVDDAGKLSGSEKKSLIGLILRDGK